MASRQTVLAFSLLCLLLTPGCGKVIGGLTEVLSVREKIAKQFGDEVSVTIRELDNVRNLSVSFVNSSLNDKNHDERAKRAQETADLIKNHYSKINTVGEIWIGYVRRTTYFVMFNTADVIELFGFDRNAHVLPDARVLPAGVRPLELETRATYLDRDDESDVAANGIQLDGIPGHGLSLVPHFTVHGDANKKKTSPPKEVSFDVASYSQEEKFKGEITFKFVVNGQPTVSTKGKFVSYAASDTFSQFCYLKFPYQTFQRIVAGETLTIKIGEIDYPVTTEQLEALKKMTSYVND